MWNRNVLLGVSLMLGMIQARAQSISSDQLKELLRNQQLLGTYQPQRSLVVNANQVGLHELDSSLGTANTKLVFRRKKVELGFLPLTIVQQYNSKVPYEWNMGAMIPARGYQAMLHTGVYTKIGKHIDIQIAPEFVTAENKDFEHFPQTLSSQHWAARYRFWNTIDLPEQFHSGSYQKLLPGQSYIKYNTKNFSVGISTENLWWGPGYRNALVMSTNAPGFLHATVNTLRPIATPIGDFEGQIIGGKLEATDILPPRIYSTYNGQFLYQPKTDEWRYLAGMILTWRSKWTPNLYLGIAKASYLYHNDISNPLDVLPFQGFFGRARTQAERNGTKASMGSLFFRYVMPKEQAELYMEYGRKEISLMPWNIIQSDPYRRAFVAGFRKLFDTKDKASHILFAFEITQMQAPTANLILDPDSWYTHRYVRQGYTQMGRVIGAGIGPGSNSQTIDIGWVKGLKKIGLRFERVRHNSDFYYYAFESLKDFRRHWVDLSATLQGNWNIGQLLLNAQFGVIRSYNYQWLIVQIGPNTSDNYFVPGNEVLNLSGRVGVSYRW